jgi:ATP-binding cassette subfamily B protein
MNFWWVRLANYAKPQRRGITVAISVMLIGIFMNLLKPWPLKIIVDYVLTKKTLPKYVAWATYLPGGASEIALLAWFAFGTILIFLASHAVAMTQSYVRTGVGGRLMYGMGAALFYRIQRLSLGFHNNQKIGDTLRRVTTDAGCVSDLVMKLFLPTLDSILTLVIMFAVMWGLNRPLALIAIIVAIPLGLVIKLFLRPMAEQTFKHQQLEGEMMALTEQALAALPMIQAFGREDYEDVRFRSLTKKTLKAFLRSVLYQIQFRVSVSTVTAAGMALIMAIGGINVLYGSMTVGTLLIFLSYLQSLYAPMESLANVSSGYASTSANAKRVLEVLELEDDPKDSATARSFPSNKTVNSVCVCFKEITFGYEPDQPVLEDINLFVKPGETIALVGCTGAGKTTLVSLIPRFFDPWSGQVLLDGLDIRGVKLSSVRSMVSILLQEPFLLPITIAENISYGRSGASHQEIINAAVAARADEFIRKLPAGYATVVGERGANLSGGEKQRIAIARALLKNAPILILDEPTSSLDPKHESLFVDALEKLMKERTTFIISHRLSTVRFADRIVVLEQGRVVEEGTEQELLNQGGHFRRLYDLHFGQLAAVSKY